MTIDKGVPYGPGYSAEPEPSFTVSAVPVSIPNAGPPRVPLTRHLRMHIAPECHEAAALIEELMEALGLASEWINSLSGTTAATVEWRAVLDAVELALESAEDRL